MDTIADCLAVEKEYFAIVEKAKAYLAMLEAVDDQYVKNDKGYADRAKRDFLESLAAAI